MPETRDPWICVGCSASNPWMNVECRVCGQEKPAPEGSGEGNAHPESVGEDSARTRSSESPEAEGGGEVADRSAGERRGSVEGGEEKGGRAKRRVPLNIRWIAACAFILALLAGGGEKWAESMIKNDEILGPMIDDIQKKAESGQELTDVEKERARVALFGASWIVPLLIVMFLVFPFGIGVLVGYATGTVRDGMISVAVGMVGYFVIIAHFVPGVLIAFPYLGVGALASYIGKRLR